MLKYLILYKTVAFLVVELCFSLSSIHHSENQTCPPIHLCAFHIPIFGLSYTTHTRLQHDPTSTLPPPTMQTKSLLALLLLSAAPTITASGTTSQTVTKTVTTTVAMSPSQSSAIDSALHSYYTSLTAQKAWTSVTSVLHTALPTSDRTDTLTVFDPAITTQAWYSALPSDETKYIASVINEEQRIMSKGGAAGRPAGVVAAAGAAAVGSPSWRRCCERAWGVVGDVAGGGTGGS
ncbi:MAG: hypothetical protein FRX48_07831 [Lasallia pustulata]|uniref:Uncharacterized protein n=1 Tax=Lasallia pustulata TaxID=136370 RepID=A0A5M8PGR9_9LECA|nr:MAG: hypothetical protein FRX48_07831 [Lasallia pustulata]